MSITVKGDSPFDAYIVSGIKDCKTEHVKFKNISFGCKTIEDAEGRIFKLISSAKPEQCEDAVPRASVEYICRKNTVSTNPYEHEHHEKFIKFMDDPEMADFGRWQHSNGFNTALVAVKCDLDKVPSVTPKQRTGKWIKTARWRNVYKCDQCGNYLDFSGVNAGRGDANFCPNCGAKMEVE